MTTPAAFAVPNHALFNARDALAQTQQEVADGLSALAARHGHYLVVTANQVSRWERGITWPSPVYRRLLAEYFGRSVADLGLVRPRGDGVAPRGGRFLLTSPMR